MIKKTKYTPADEKAIWEKVKKIDTQLTDVVREEGLTYREIERLKNRLEDLARKKKELKAKLKATSYRAEIIRQDVSRRVAGNPQTPKRIHKRTRR